MPQAKKRTYAPVSKAALFAKLRERAGGTATLMPYEVPEWDCTIYLAELSGWDQEKVQTWTKGKEMTKVSDAAKMLSLVCRDEAGEHLFAEDDVKLLMQESGQVIARIMEAAAALNGVDVDEEKKS